MLLAPSSSPACAAWAWLWALERCTQLHCSFDRQSLEIAPAASAPQRWRRRGAARLEESSPRSALLPAACSVSSQAQCAVRAQRTQVGLGVSEAACTPRLSRAGSHLGLACTPAALPAAPRPVQAQPVPPPPPPLRLADAQRCPKMEDASHPLCILPLSPACSSNRAAPWPPPPPRPPRPRRACNRLLSRCAPRGACWWWRTRPAARPARTASAA